MSRAPIDFSIEFPVEFSKFDSDFLMNSARKRMKILKINTIEEYHRFLTQNPDEKSTFKELLHNNFSLFFRDPLTFNILHYIILPEIIHSPGFTNRNEIRLWSAACAAGQEVYSMGILLEEISHDQSVKWTYRIFGSDISQAQIDKAKKGIYDVESIANIRFSWVEKWFIHNRQQFEIHPTLKKNISFSVFDLCHPELIGPPESIYGEFDIIFCSNVLFYYQPNFRQSILEKISRNLSRGGVVVSGSAEREILKMAGFRELYANSSIFRKLI